MDLPLCIGHFNAGREAYWCGFGVIFTPVMDDIGVVFANGLNFGQYFPGLGDGVGTSLQTSTSGEPIWRTRNAALISQVLIS